VQDPHDPQTASFADVLRNRVVGLGTSGELWDALVDVAVTRLCSMSSVYVPVNGRLRLVATAHRDPFVRVGLGQLLEIDSNLIAQDGPHSRVFRTGIPWVAPDLSTPQDGVETVRGWDRGGESVTAAGSAMAVPISNADGVVAVWTFADHEVGALNEGLLQEVLVLLPVVNQTVLRMSSEPAQGPLQTLSRLQFYSAALVTSTSTEDIANAFTTLGLPAADAVAGSFSVVEGATVRLAATRGLGEAINDRWVTFDLNSANPISEVLLSGRPFVAATRTEFLALYPGLRDDIEAVDHQAWIVLPLMWADVVHAAVGFIWDAPIVANAELHRKLLTVADLTAQAVHVVGLTNEAVQLSVALQQSMFQHDLPSSMAGVSLGAVYQPAFDHARAGGDWYDVIETNDDHLLVVLGDVTGSGAAAAAQMGRIRAMVQVLGFEGHEPSRIAELTSGALQRLNAPVFATCVIARYQPTTGRFTWTNAGHLFPVLAQPGADVRLLTGTHGPPLNGVDDATYQQDSLVLAPGSRVVVASDGVIERAGEMLDVGLDRLVDATSSGRSVDVARLPQFIVDALQARQHRSDDVAVLAFETVPLRERLGRD
jgi:serine phosphatase RsbU (regulator of sigma subunit)